MRRSGAWPTAICGACGAITATRSSTRPPRSRASPTTCSRWASCCSCSSAPGSAALAGATVAAVTLPSLVTGPLLGAWLDRSGRRRQVMMLDQVLAATSVLGIVAAGRQRARLPGAAGRAGRGHHVAAVVRRLHQPDPGDRPGQSCWRRPTRSRRRASTSPSSRAPRWRERSRRSRGRPTALIVEAVLTIAALGLIARIPQMDARAPSRRPRRVLCTRSCATGCAWWPRPPRCAR